MNDPELDEPIQKHFSQAAQNIHEFQEQQQDTELRPSLSTAARSMSRTRNEESVASIKKRLDEEVGDEKEDAYFQHTLWWFTSTAFPLIAGTFGPISNLFSVCALVQTWRLRTEDNGRVKDPAWIITMNSISLVVAVTANILLLLTFARRIPYKLSLPITILLWYTSSTLLTPPLILTHTKYLSPNSHAGQYTLSQSYYYALISACLYTTISTILLLNFIGSIHFHAYPASFSKLTVPQRTLMLQTLVFSFYLALFGGVFARIEGWSFVDGVYWAEYTLLTIGLGSDLQVQSVLGRMLLIPFAAFGIVLVGIIVGSVRGLVLERARVKVGRRMVGKELERLSLKHREEEEKHKVDVDKTKPNGNVKNELEAMEHKWRKKEFELMRQIEEKAEKAQRYTGLASAVFVFLLVWIAGSLVFWAFEEPNSSWSYPTALYFTYTTITTIGYGDLFPTTPPSRPFFVLWTLLAVPAVTILVSHMGSTVVRGVSYGVEVIGRWTVLPEAEKKLRAVGLGGEGEEGGEGGEERKEKKSLGKDVEHLGSVLEKEEEESGRGESLPARLAREIRNVSRDVGEERRYEWEEWVRILELIAEPVEGELGRRQGRDAGFKSAKSTRQGSNGEGAAHEEEQERKEERERDEATWSWLDDHGPLFSTEGETQWILGRLCQRLEEVYVAESRSVASVGGGKEK